MIYIDMAINMGICMMLEQEDKIKKKHSSLVLKEFNFGWKECYLPNTDFSWNRCGYYSLSKKNVDIVWQAGNKEGRQSRWKVSKPNGWKQWSLSDTCAR